MGDMIDESLIRDWFEEGYGQIEQIESNLLILEKDVENKEAVDEIFRAAHTLKGGSAVVHFDEISRFTHILEDSMDIVRSGRVKVTSGMVDTLLDALDVIKNMIDERNSGGIYEDDYSTVVSQLQAIVEEEAKSAAELEPVEQESPTPSAGGDESQEGEELGEYDMMEIENANRDNQPVYRIKVSFNENNPMKTVGGIQVFTSLRDIGMIIKTEPDFDELYSEEFYKEVIYIIATDADTDRIKRFATVPDTTQKIEVTPVKTESGGSVKKEKKPASQSIKITQNGDTVTIHQDELDALKEDEPRGGGPEKKKSEADIDELARQITEESLVSLEDEHKTTYQKSEKTEKALPVAQKGSAPTAKKGRETEGETSETDLYVSFES